MIIVSRLEEGKTYVFSTTAYDIYGNESAFSNKVYFSVSRSDTDGDGISVYSEVVGYIAIESY